MDELRITRRQALQASGAVGLASTLSPVFAEAASFAGNEGAHLNEAPPESAALAAQAVDGLSRSIIQLRKEVWTLAEVSLAEVESSKRHRDFLRRSGFTIVSEGTSGVPTAFIAEWTRGTGGPIIGYLPEYDALPGLGNAAEPMAKPAPNGKTSGHGCGHDVLGAGCTGAAIALKAMMEQRNINGTVRVYGCAAEETEGAKVYMARDGHFDDLDAALAFHPAPVAVTGPLTTAATNQIKVIFRGRTAHAGVSPWEGRSALKAAEMFGIGVQMMREHVRPTARLHYIYQNAGLAPNVVPDFAQIWLVVRDENRQGVEDMSAWLREIAQGAAIATQTQSEFEIFFGMWDLLPNEPLIRACHRHMLAHPPKWTDAEQTFARRCQKALGLPEAGMASEVMPIIPPLSFGGSTDLGDVSYLAPTGVFGWPSLPLGVSLHTWPVTACGGMSIGDKASLDSAKILAGVGYDLMTDANLRAEAKADLIRRKGDTVYKSPLPPDRKVPLGLPDFLRKTGQDEIVSGVKP